MILTLTTFNVYGKKWKEVIAEIIPLIYMFLILNNTLTIQYIKMF